MKALTSWISATVIIWVLALAPAHGAMRADPVAQVRVVKLTGSASFTDAAGKSGPLETGMYLGEGTTITTEIASGVVLDFGSNGRILNVKDNSKITIETLKLRNTGADLVAETKLNLEKWRILGNVKKLSASSRFEVKTARGVAGIRGTSFEIYAVGIYRCITGQIVVVISNLSNPKEAPRAFTVTQGNSVNAGGDTVPAVAPIPPKEMQALMGQIKDLPVLFKGVIAPGGPKPPPPPGTPPDNENRKYRDLLDKAKAAGEEAVDKLKHLGVTDPDTLEKARQTATAAFLAGAISNPGAADTSGTTAANSAFDSVILPTISSLYGTPNPQ